MEFANDLVRFPACHAIVPYLRQLPSTMNLEQVLERLNAEAPSYPERYKQLAAVRCYLHFMIWRCQQRWSDEAKGITNYVTLLDQILRWRKETDRICLVTFNYDTMLETALPTVGIHITGLRDYIRYEPFALVKLHGSVNWWREVGPPVPDIEKFNPWEVLNYLINRAIDLKFGDTFVLKQEYPFTQLGGKALFPALAIPLQNKASFECPSAHLDTLRTFIPAVTKILTVGWHATENHFLKLLVDGLAKRVRVMIVDRNESACDGPINNLRSAGLDGDFSRAKGGFSEFVANREGDEFLRS